MARLTRLFVVLIPCLLLPISPAYPCGESLFRIGFGVTLPMGPVLHPAKIAIFKASKVDPDVFYSDVKVSSRLSKTGHKVSLVDGAAEIVADPQSAQFDVVIVREGEINQARSALGSRVTHAVFIPVHDAFAKAKDTAMSLPVNATLREILSVLQHAMQPAVA